MADEPIVATYLRSADVAVALLGSPPVREKWGQPSALRNMAVGHLAGHLARAILLTEPFLDAPSEDSEALDPADYYLAGGDSTDLESHGNRRVRETGAETAAIGCDALVAQAGAALTRLSLRLPYEDLDVARSWFGRVATTRTVLAARVLEIVVHVDDLAESVGESSPALPKAAFDSTIEVLVEMARRRHSDVAVVRSLARRERDLVNALRVL